MSIIQAMHVDAPNHNPRLNVDRSGWDRNQPLDAGHEWTQFELRT